LAKIGLVNKIADAVFSIDAGRKGFAIIGKEREGRVSYETGISDAMTAFQEAQAAADPQALILAEYTFLTQELQFCAETDENTLSSLTQALQSFDDAFLALKTVEEPCYKAVETTTPHNRKYRVQGYPQDSFHIACIAHKTRIKNILRTPGLDPIEKALLKQRLANLPAAQEGYLEKQKKAFLKEKS